MDPTGRLFLQNMPGFPPISLREIYELHIKNPTIAGLQSDFKDGHYFDSLTTSRRTETERRCLELAIDDETTYGRMHPGSRRYIRELVSARANVSPVLVRAYMNDPESHNFALQSLSMTKIALL
jgi:hypothetical protein